MDINKVAQAWIEMWNLDVDDPARDQFEWVEDFEYGAVHENPEAAIDLVLEVLNLNQGNNILEVLSAGPLEQVLAEHGPSIIDRVENLARANKEFSSLLGGVWKNAMTEEVWARVQQVQNRSGWDGNA